MQPVPPIFGLFITHKDVWFTTDPYIFPFGANCRLLIGCKGIEGMTVYIDAMIAADVPAHKFH